MSRPKKATVDYFPHFVNHGKTMFTLENKYGNDGYAFWFKLLEILGSSEHHFINCNDIEMWEFLIAKTRVSEDIAIEILNLLSKLGAINKELWECKIIRSDNYIQNLDTVYKRREVNVLSNDDVRSLCIQKPHTTGISADKKPQSKVKESKVKESKVVICAEQAPAPPIITLTLNDKTEYPISQTLVDEMTELYPAVDVMQQFREMRAWLISNPTKRKTKIGIMRFVNTWLSKEQDKGRASPKPTETPKQYFDRPTENYDHLAFNPFEE